MSIISVTPQTVRHQFTVEEYTLMHESGVFREDDRVELLAGEVLHMSPVGPLHIAIINNLTEFLAPQVAGRAKLSVQNSILLDDRSEPMPDLVLLRPREDNYHQTLPAPADILLLIEVSQTSLDYDRLAKLPRYAAAEIPEVWIVDVAEQVVEQYTEPMQGHYTQLRKHLLEGEIVATGLSGVKLATQQIFA